MTRTFHGSASALLDQSYYVNQLVCALGGVLVFVAKSEWMERRPKKMEKVEFDMSIDRDLSLPDFIVFRKDGQAFHEKQLLRALLSHGPHC